MYARQLAWLSGAVPGSDGKPSRTSRAQQIVADGGTVRLPELTDTHLLRCLQGAGTCMQGAVGAVALSSAELVAWCQGMRLRLAAWEFDAILRASRAYCDQLNTTTDVPPWGDIRELSDPAVIGKRIAKSLGSLARPLGRKKRVK